MCGRYSLSIRMATIRANLESHGMEVDGMPDDDDDLRETYNFAPGYYGAVYLGAAVENRGSDEEEEHNEDNAPEDNQQHPPSGSKHETNEKKTKYKLQKMRWGLIPFWTKRQPDYGSMMRTINCRDDSLIDDRGMWTSMKRKKRCVVVCQGFYEWLKKGPGGKERVPHFTKRKDGDLMWFAGLWDCVKYEGSDEKLYTYTIITTESNSYLRFLHDRMPVILEPGSEQMKKWLDPHQTTWTSELQSMLKPYDGELDCYPVSKEVGKVGNNSPNFIVPVNSKENKKNIANFFANAAAKKKEDAPKTESEETKDMPMSRDGDDVVKGESPEQANESPRGVKRELSSEDADAPSAKAIKPEQSSPTKHPLKVTGRPMRSATTNKSSPRKGSSSYGTSKHASDGSQRITNFFK